VWAVKSLSSVMSANKFVASGWDGGHDGSQCNLETDAL
jgi:hypothetical protein